MDFSLFLSEKQHQGQVKKSRDSSLEHAGTEGSPLVSGQAATLEMLWATVLLSSIPSFVETPLFSGTPNQLISMEKWMRQHREPCHKLTSTVSDNQQYTFDRRERMI